MFPEPFCDVLICMQSWKMRALAIVAMGLLTSCGAAARSALGGGPGASPTAAATVAAPTDAAAGPGVPRNTPPPNGPRTVVIGDQDNGHPVSLRAGERLQVVLGSTYWQVEGSSDPSVLRPAGQPTVAPQLKGCVAGEGCGTVTALFDAVAPGQAAVSAARTSCGEAMSCTGNLGLYHVTVTVTA
jgi:hypothetical protein